MGEPKFTRTASGEEIVILSREDYEDLRDAADAASTKAALARGEEELLSIEETRELLEAPTPLHFWRRKRNLTQEMLAKTLGTSQGFHLGSRERPQTRRFRFLSTLGVGSPGAGRRHPAALRGGQRPKRCGAVNDDRAALLCSPTLWNPGVMMEPPRLIAETPAPPYYAVVFTSVRTPADEGYAEMAAAMDELAARQPGYLGVESAREEVGITVSYWRDLESVAAWKRDVDHVAAQRLGRERWYAVYRVWFARVECEYGFARAAPEPESLTYPPQVAPLPARPYLPESSLALWSKMA